MGVYKMKMGVGFDGEWLVGWDLSQIWQSRF